jgi:hypothetical protein
MAALASTDVTYTLQEGTQKSGSDCRYEAVFKVAFGDGALTYPSGGIPLTKAKLGCPTKVEEIILSDPDSASGIVVKMDYVNLQCSSTYAQHGSHRRLCNCNCKRSEFRRS